MKKKLLLLTIIIIIILVYPRKVEHAVVIQSNTNYISVLINNKIKKIKYPNKFFSQFSIINYKHNFIKAYDFNKVLPIKDRIMIKSNNVFELEKLGLKSLSKNPIFYKIDRYNNIHKCSIKDLIVGKNNVKSFLDSENNIKTCLVFPLDFSNTRVAISNSNFSTIYHDIIKINTITPSQIFSYQENFKFELPENSNILIYKNKNKFTLVSNNLIKDFTKRIYIKCSSLNFLNIQRGNPIFMPNYSGILEFTPSEKGITIVNEINIEEYLSKVVPSEMPAWASLEALKCQAVAARTYAISDMLKNRYSNLGFYVDDSTRCQVFNNIKEHPLSTKAVDETSGIIVTYNQNPIDAKYYSTSCGSGVCYDNIWFNSNEKSEFKPYLVTNNFLIDYNILPYSEEDWLNFYKSNDIKAYDKNSPYYRWKINFSYEQLNTNIYTNLRNLFDNYPEYITIYHKNKKIKKLPLTLGKLQDIRITKRSDGGNIIELSFVFNNYIVNIKKDCFVRRVFGSTNKYTNLPPILRYKGKPITEWSTLPSSFFSVEKENDEYTIYGGGYGHGVGMSQYGAIYLADQGKNFKDILNTYYKNIKIVDLY